MWRTKVSTGKNARNDFGMAASMNLSKKERQIYDAMCAEPERVWTPDDIAGIIWSGKHRPSSWRQAATSTMLLLVAKTQTASPRVVRLGRFVQGVRASYALKE